MLLGSVSTLSNVSFLLSILKDKDIFKGGVIDMSQIVKLVIIVIYDHYVYGCIVISFCPIIICYELKISQLALTAV